MPGKDELPRNNPSRMLYLVGGANSMTKEDEGALLDLLFEATAPLCKKGLDCQPDYVLSGGTNSGVAGVAANYGRKLGVPVHGWLPTEAQPAKRVKPHFHKPEGAFSVEQPLAMWKYLGERGALQPNSLVVVATSGGPIANAELAIAAACDVPIALLPFGNPEATESASRLFRPEKRQLIIPNDEMVLRAFLLRSWGVMSVSPDPDSSPLDPRLEEAAIRGHRRYRRTQSTRTVDTESPENAWKVLTRDLKQSTLDAKAAHIHYVREAGIHMNVDELLPDEVAAQEMRSVLGKDETLKEKLAELEHGRWVIQRFERGVKRGPRPYRGDPPNRSSLRGRIKAFFIELRNNLFRGGRGNEVKVDKSVDLTHSDVVRWKDLPKEVRDHDFSSINDIPKLYGE